MLNKTSYHMCDSRYFPKLLLRDGSLTLIYIASLMVLVKLCDSLPKLVKLPKLVWWSVMLVWSWLRGGALRIFLESFPRGPCRLPNVVITLNLSHFYKLLHFLCDGVLILWATMRFLMMLPPSEVNLNAHFTTHVFETFIQSSCIGYLHMDVFFLVTVVCFCGLYVFTICHVICVAPHLPQISQHLCHLTLYNFGKYNIFHGHEAMLFFFLGKSFSVIGNISLLQNLENFVLLINTNKLNEKVTFTY